MEPSHVIAVGAVAASAAGSILGGLLLLYGEVSTNTLEVTIMRNRLLDVAKLQSEVRATLAVVEDRQRRRCPSQ